MNDDYIFNGELKDADRDMAGLIGIEEKRQFGKIVMIP